MKYLYGCNQDPAHARREVIHSMQANPEVRCPTCNSQMHRIPQLFRWYMNPQGLLLDKMDAEFNKRVPKRR